MSAARQMPRALLAMGASLVVLTACSATGASPSPSPTECSGASPAQFTAGTSGELCADTGFMPQSDGFSFANWGGTPTNDAIDSGTLIAMFGRDPVCANSDEATCTIRPAAQAWMNQMNEALANGRCEGMAVLSERLYQGLVSAAELDPGAQRTIELARTQPAVARTLGYWWLTQFPTEVATPTSKSRSLTPAQIVEQVITGLKEGAGNTLGLYSEFGGHAVTPIAVVKENANYTISVYDSNDPGVIKHVIVDPHTNSWVYDAKTNSTGKVTERWRGTGAGSMDLTPMSLRTGAFTAPFSDDAANGSTYITVTSPKDGANLGAVITRGSSVIDTRSLTQTLPDGVSVHHITGTGAGVQVIIDGDADSLEVRAVSSDSSAVATLSIDAPGKPMVTVRGRTGKNAGKALAIMRNDAGAISVQSADGEKARTTISTENETIQLAAPQSAGIRVSSAPSPETSLIDQAGTTIATYTSESAPTTTSSPVTETTLELNAQADGFTVARSMTTPQPVAPSPVIEVAPAPSTSSSSSRERKEKNEGERGKKSERPSKSRGDKPAEASSTPSASPTPSPSRSRTPEKSHDGGSPGNGHSSDDKPRTPSSPTSTAPTLVTSASPSASATASPSVTPSASASLTSSASANPTASASSSRSATPTPTPTPSSTKKNDDTKDEKKDKPKKQDDEEDDD